MASYQDNYQLLMDKLDRFIRKYYVNQLIRGGLYSTALLLALFLGLNFLEYQFYFQPSVRTVLFFSFTGISVAALAGWVAVPLLHYFRLGRVISHEQAARIIGRHFQDVQDKLLNVLQLRNQVGAAESRELILASIAQKAAEVRPIPFQRAIDLGQNRKYLKYALPPLLLLLVVLFAAPSLIRDSTGRLIRYDRTFEKPAPFRFVVDAASLQVVQYGQFVLSVATEGEAVPNEVFIDIEGIRYRLAKQADGTFSYQFNNVGQDTDFRLRAGSVESEEYTLDVLEKPNITGFEVRLDYPAYTGRTDESLESIGDLTVPAGTQVDWLFDTRFTDGISLRFGADTAFQTARQRSADGFTFRRLAMKDEMYRLFLSNRHLPAADSVTYSIRVVPDAYPLIQAEQFVDSTQNRVLFFAGDASDDYGLLSLAFHYRIRRDGRDGPLVTEKLPKEEGKAIRFDHVFDLNGLALQPGDEVNYYFEVADNDGVNGSKTTRTPILVFAMPTLDELEARQEENNEAIKEKLSASIQENEKVQADMQKLRDKLLQQKELDWQTRKELEKLLERQQELQQQIEDAKKAFQENLRQQEEFQPPSEALQEKQEQLEELMENAEDRELQDLMEKIEELLQELQKDQALEMMEEMQSSQEQKEKDLDRLLELYKQLEFEYEVQQAIDKLEQLAEKQEQLSEETMAQDEKKEDSPPAGEQGEENGDQEKSPADLEKKQEELNKEFEKVEQQMESLDKKSQQMQNQQDFDDQQQDRESIREDMQDSQESLQQQQNQKAARKQKSAAKKMREMAGNMAQQMQGQQMEQMEMDLKALRQLLENIVGLSFAQEDLMDAFAPVDITTPLYVSLTQTQKKLQDDFKITEDSLYALAKRSVQMEGFITDKVAEIKDNMRKSLSTLEERQKPQASEQQQRAMKNLNDLALMLSEVMEQMQMQMSGMMPGSQMCSNPGGNGGQSGRSPKDKLSEGQQEINKGMKKMQGEQQGGNTPSSKEFAQMAARQAAIRKALAEQQRKLQEQGKGSKELQQIMDQMDKIETELVNKRLTNDMLRRQQDILTRLLQHERAEQQRELDDKRKSETAGDKERKAPPALEEYLRKREAAIDQLRTVNPALKPYYKQLVETYYQSLKTID